MDEAKVISLFSEVRQQIRDHFAGLTSWPKRPERFCNIACRSFESDRWNAGWFLAVVLFQFRLVVESVDMADCTRAVNHQDLLGRHREVRRTRCVRVVGIDLRADWRLAAGSCRRVCKQAIAVEHLQESQAGSRQPRRSEKPSAVE